MASLVAGYLDKARIAARTAIVGRRADPTIVMLRLTRVMGKLNPNRSVTFARPGRLAALVPRRGIRS